MSIRSRHSRRTVPTKRSAKALARGPDWRANDPNTLRTEDLVETGRELGVAIPDQELDRLGTLGKSIGQVCALTEPRDLRSLNPAFRDQ